MKKIISIFAACLLVGALAAVLTGCGSASEGTHEDAGEYNIYSISDGETSFGNDTISMLGLEDMITLSLNEDGTGKLVVATGDTPETTEIEWHDGVLSKDGDDLEYTMEDGLLHIELDGQSLVMQKK